MKRLLPFALFFVIAVAAIARTPPVAPVRPVVDDYFGTKVTDNYRYFEDLKNPEVQKWMKAQADYTRQTLDSLPGYPALLKHIEELTTSYAAAVSNLQIVGGRYYSLRTPANAQSPKLYVRNGIHGKNKLLIDPETPPAGPHRHLFIGGYSPSPDGHYVAYIIAAGVTDRGVLHILDVDAGEDLLETANRTYGDPLLWRANRRTIRTTQTGFASHSGRPEAPRCDRC